MALARMPVNRIQLVKILELLGSSHDGEALSAARRAHSLIKAGGEPWEELLIGRAPQQVMPRAAQPAPTAKRRRLLTTYDMYQALQNSTQVPQEIKKRLRGNERALIDGELSPAEIGDIKRLFEQLVAGPSR